MYLINELGIRFYFSCWGDACLRRNSTEDLHSPSDFSEESNGRHSCYPSGKFCTAPIEGMIASVVIGYFLMKTGIDRVCLHRWSTLEFSIHPDGQWLVGHQVSGTASPLPLTNKLECWTKQITNSSSQPSCAVWASISEQSLIRPDPMTFRTLSFLMNMRFIWKIWSSSCLYGRGVKEIISSNFLGNQESLRSWQERKHHILLTVEQDKRVDLKKVLRW